MPAQRKNLGDYKKKMQEYIEKNRKMKISTMSKTELNLILGIDRKYIHDCRRRAQKWQLDFLNEYDKTCSIIAKSHLKSVLKNDNYKWQYLRSNHRSEFDDLINNNDNDNLIIEINLQNPRNLEEE